MKKYLAFILVVVHGMLHNAKKAEGFIEITPLEPNHRVNVEVYCCEACRIIQFTY